MGMEWLSTSMDGVLGIALHAWEKSLPMLRLDWKQGYCKNVPTDQKREIFRYSFNRISIYRAVITDNNRSPVFPLLRIVHFLCSGRNNMHFVNAKGILNSSGLYF